MHYNPFKVLSCLELQVRPVRTCQTPPRSTLVDDGKGGGFGNVRPKRRPPFSSSSVSNNFAKNLSIHLPMYLSMIDLSMIDGLIDCVELTLELAALCSETGACITWG